MMTRKEKFVSVLKSKTPELEVSFKDESLLMKILSVVLFFNTSFMKSFVTTIGNTIYFPDRKDLLIRTDMQALMTLAHEYQHVKDYQKNRPWFLFSYLFPLTLLPFAILSIVFLPWFVTLALSLLCLAPWPAIWRKKWELRGYSMSLFVFDKIAREQGASNAERIDTLTSLADHYNTHFTGFNYYLMWPFGVRDTLEEIITDVLSGDLQKSDVIFSEVVEALENSKGSK